MLSLLDRDAKSKRAAGTDKLSIGFTGWRWTTGYHAEEAALSEDELFRRRQTDHLWQVDPCGPGGAIIGFWVPVRGPGEATDGSDAYTSIPGGGKGLKGSYEVGIPMT